ncbi:MAG: molybdopterin-synthase adenylyltransferase [Actinomycetota bacterium]|nr:molybdopterin-synthase adenylyltransferase [Actinomycetota bacterium]
MSEFRPERVFSRHPRLHGSILMVGAGAVGSLLANELAALGCGPIRIIDFDILESHNITRHKLGANSIGRPKAIALAEKLREELPHCQAIGLNADFTKLPVEQQIAFAREADVVIAASDTVECQRAVNEICLRAEVPAVYPGIWSTGRVSDAEVGEIQWVLPGRHTPCYLCATGWRTGAGFGGGNVEARGGVRADLQVLVQATVWVVAALLEPRSERASILDADRTLMLTHGFMPESVSVRQLFDGQRLQYLRIEFPTQPCLACGGSRPRTPPASTAGGSRTAQAPTAEPPVAQLPPPLRTPPRDPVPSSWPMEPEPTRSSAAQNSLRDPHGNGLAGILALVGSIVCAVVAWKLGHSLNTQQFNSPDDGYAWKYPLSLLLWLVAAVLALGSVSSLWAWLTKDQGNS